MKYINLLYMTIISFISMYLLMYAMVDSCSNIYFNLNQLYMAGIMTVPMILLELIIMKSMYHDKKQNALIMISSIMVGIVLFIFIRNQTAISDKEFLKSMIPHHAAAILMVEKAVLHDPQVQELARKIITTQQYEIEFMKMKLEEC